MLRVRALELLLERRRERRVLELDAVFGYALALVLPLEAERRAPLGHKGHHALARVGLGLDAQPVERHERHTARARLLELLHELGRDVVAVDDHVEELVARGHVDGRVELAVTLDQLEQQAVHALDLLLAHDALACVDSFPLCSAHRVRQRALCLGKLLLYRLALLAHVGVAPPQLLALVRQLRVLGAPARALVLRVRHALAPLVRLRTPLGLVLFRLLALVLGGVELLLEAFGLLRLLVDCRAQQLRLLGQVLVALLLRAEALPAGLFRVKLLQHRLDALDLARGRGGSVLQLLRLRLLLTELLLDVGDARIHLLELRLLLALLLLALCVRDLLSLVVCVEARRVLELLLMLGRTCLGLGDGALEALAEHSELPLVLLDRARELLVVRSRTEGHLARLGTFGIRGGDLALCALELRVVVRVLGHLAPPVEARVGLELVLLSCEPRELLLDRRHLLLAPLHVILRVGESAQRLRLPVVVRRDARNVLERVEPLLLARVHDRGHLELRHDVELVGA
eukprot:jgi/Chrpa1/2522/Chrysochromulina_OHIO_Genome00014952-RA